MAEQQSSESLWRTVQSTLHPDKIQSPLSERIWEAVLATLHQGKRCELQIFPDVDDAREEFEASNRLADACQKNPGHKDFIPIKDLTLHHLPNALRNEISLNHITYQANCTVKLTVRYTSGDRPADFSMGVPSGSCRTRVGTGRVVHVPPSNTMTHAADGVFTIQTAAHVVYNDAEASQTHIEFFFDDDVDKSGVVSATGLRVKACDAENDWCTFSCAVQDPTDARVIMQTLDKGEKNLSVTRSKDLNTAFCISHPHGLSKRVSFGRVSSFNEIPHSNYKGVHIVKLLVNKCFNMGLSEKKTLSAYYESHRLPQFTNVSSDDQNPELFHHLVSIGLLEQSSNKEKEMVMNKFETTMGNFNSVTENTVSSDPEYASLSQGDKELLKKKTLDTLVQNEASGVHVTDGFEERVGKIEAEVYNQVCSIVYGDEGHTTGLIDSVTYSTPTCPGSSGAAVYMYVWQDTGVRRLYGQHSRGIRKNVGNVCSAGYPTFML